MPCWLFTKGHLNFGGPGSVPEEGKTLLQVQSIVCHLVHTIWLVQRLHQYLGSTRIPKNVLLVMQLHTSAWPDYGLLLQFLSFQVFKDIKQQYIISSKKKKNAHKPSVLQSIVKNSIRAFFHLFNTEAIVFSSVLLINNSY